MNKWSGYLRRDGDLEFRVGAMDPVPQPDDQYPYVGPCARVYADADWVYVNTDDYEGCAMLNIEALPYLIEALQEIQKIRKIEKRDYLKLEDEKR